MSSPSEQPRVGLIMGSRSDWPTMKGAAEVLRSFGVPYEAAVVSAHRTPERMREYAREAASRGLEAIVAGAGGAAHLPGMVAAWTTLPVFGVPVESRVLKGVDSLLSIVQMPGGVPVATLAVGSSGAKNAALMCVRQFSVHDDELRAKLVAFHEEQEKASLEARLE